MTDATPIIRRPRITHDGKPLGYVEPYVRPAHVPAVFRVKTSLDKSRKGGLVKMKRRNAR